ncbi:putative iron/ascorbate oxidoreductase DDB_G0283291 [Talaromyces islandicus]|uniref:Putative iron/ascorbate oxidoreductase DDB_G0283291 n=1 Tax=Talaromyces islandicus TaxID=28573 RepID=A0A0U1LWU2_TALIS|nr:putative iron/ascorbate oxidoreductase DDB_G0283291 [Talaromyces islandicus]
MADSFTSIPIIDLSPTTANKPQQLAQLHHALTSVGFLYIRNHDVCADAIADLVGALPRLFALNDTAKEQIALHHSPHFLGYSCVGAETTAGNLDYREQVEYATELAQTWTPENGQPLYERLKGPNQWPSELPNLRPIVERYMRELTSLGERFLRLVAEALGLPSSETFFPFLSEQHRLKLVHYPAGHTADQGQGQGVGPHKDSSGWWTFLLQASPPHIQGLQALNRAGQWIDIPNIPGTFVVNIGQAFEVVTHGVCKATVHRVLSGPEERYSIPFFQGVRGSLTKTEALDSLKEYFQPRRGNDNDDDNNNEDNYNNIDSPFLNGNYNTWGESQLRTKIRSHRDVGSKFYADVYEQYVND